MDSAPIGGGTVNTSQAGRREATEATANERGIKQDAGTRSRLASIRQSVVVVPTTARQVTSLAYDGDHLRSKAGKDMTVGRVRNMVADALPFVGKTNYGNILQHADSYIALAPHLTLSEKIGQLNILKAEIAAWQQSHHDKANTGKGQAIADLGQAVADALDEARDQTVALGNSSRKKAMDAVDNYVGPHGKGPNFDKTTLFRGKSEAATALATHLEQHAPASYRTDVSTLADRLTAGFDPGNKQVVDEEWDRDQPAKAVNQLQDRQFNALLGQADRMMGGLIGGKDRAAIKAAVDELPAEIVATLAELDQRVAAGSDDDAATRRNALIGTLFLRFAVPAMGEGADINQPEGRAKRMLSNVVQAVVNNAGDDRTATTIASDRHKPDLLAFVRSYAQPMQIFLDAVLERGGRPPL